MGWELLIPIIAREGILVAAKLWNLYRSNAEPTQADWDELTRLSKLKYDDYVKS
jgi:hypothetical protein